MISLKNSTKKSVQEVDKCASYTLQFCCFTNLQTVMLEHNLFSRVCEQNCSLILKTKHAVAITFAVVSKTLTQQAFLLRDVRDSFMFCQIICSIVSEMVYFHGVQFQFTQEAKTAITGDLVVFVNLVISSWPITRRSCRVCCQLTND